MSTCTWQVRSLVSLVLFITMLLAHPVHAASPTPIIGEVAWAGSSLSTADEWLELWNTSDAPLPLAGYELDGASNQPLIFGANDVIPPKSVFLISNYDANNTKTTLTTTPNLVTSNVSLSNDTLAIVLKDPTGTIIDRAGNGEKPPAGSSAAKSSMVRQTDLSWQSAVNSLNLKPDVTDLGTPGFCDGCTATVPEIEDTPPASTSTEVILDETLPTSTTTDQIPIPILVPEETEVPIESSSTEPTSTEPILIPESTTTTSTTSTPPTPIVITIQPRLYQAMSNPSTGPEWVELDHITSTDLPYLQDWRLEDAVGPIFHFSATQTELKVSLSKNYLNNTGDTLKLFDQHGQLMDQVDLPARAKDQVWNRDELPALVDPPVLSESPSSTEGSTEPTTPTIIVQGIPIPVGANVADPAPPTFAPVPTITPVPTVKTAIVKTKSTKIKAQAKSQIKPKIKPIEPKIKTPKAKPVITKTKITKPKAKSKAKPKTPKSTSNTSQPIIPATFDMLNHIEAKTRVRLIGTVGSLPGQVGQNYFILHNPDGRGLLVHSNQNKPIPALGTRISISGVLALTNTNLYLTMQKLDTWKIEPTSTTPILPRAVDLITPAQEDAWSLVDVTATVLEVHGATIYLDVDGIDLQAKIKPMVHYRASRLNPGDLIRLRGLYDIKGDVPAIYPRSPDEILVLHAASAKISTPATTSNSLPTWTPFGAAGATIAFTQGYKKLKERREKHALQQAVHKVRQTKAVTVLPTSTQLDNVPDA